MFQKGSNMKIKLNCSYGDQHAGEEADVDDVTGKAMIETGAASAHEKLEKPTKATAEAEKTK